MEKQTLRQGLVYRFLVLDSGLGMKASSRVHSQAGGPSELLRLDLAGSWIEGISELSTPNPKKVLPH